MERQVLNSFCSKQRRLLRSAVKFSLYFRSQIAPLRPVHARTAITRPGRYLTHAHSHITRAEPAISVERTQNSGTLLNSCLRERKLTFLFIPFILHCQTSKSNESGTVTEEEARELAKSLGTSYVENSATTGENVRDVVHTALRVVADQRKLQRSKCRRHRLFKWINKCKHRK